MKNRYFSNSIAFLLLTLILLKVSSFHEYTHQDANADDIENCKICELATENQDNDFVIVTPVVLTTATFVTYTYEPIVSYDLVLSSSFLHASFFGRPPPQLS